jgi:SPP1 family predicted phage head-tail adaptor
MKRARAGMRDKRITIEKEIETDNTTYGGTNKEWRTHKKLWASIKPYSRAMEDFEGNTVRSQKILVFETQYDSSITSQMRVNYLDVIYNIRSINEPAEFRKILMDIFAESED